MTQDPQLRVLACQINIPPMTTSEARDEHLVRSVSVVNTAIDEHGAVDVVILPELSSLDYSRDAFEQLNTLAEDEQGASFNHWRDVALQHHCWVLFGFARKSDQGFYISTAAITPDGRLAGFYDKLHLAQFGDSMEKEYFNQRGDHLLVVDINGFRVAPIICYDIRIPELCRTLAVDHQVDLIAHVGAYARDPSFYSWHAFATTRAIENQVYFLSLNRAGDHFGHSRFCPPWIDEQHIAETFDEHAEECRVFTLTKSAIVDARRDYTFLEDRLSGYALPVTGTKHN